jgi:hypothetical protein
MLTKTNQLFCYWLQGYFEIGIDVSISPKVIDFITQQLDTIEEKPGEFTAWLKEVCVYIESYDYSDAMCTHFRPIIQRALNDVFYHVIDNSYDDTGKTKEELQHIHDGASNDERRI